MDDPVYPREYRTVLAKGAAFPQFEEGQFVHHKRMSILAQSLCCQTGGEAIPDIDRLGLGEELRLVGGNVEGR